MRFTDEMSNNVARFANVLATQCDGVRSEYRIYKERKKRKKKRYHPCVSEPRSRAAAEVEEQRGAAEAHTRRRA